MYTYITYIHTLHIYIYYINTDISQFKVSGLFLHFGI